MSDFDFDGPAQTVQLPKGKLKGKQPAPPSAPRALVHEHPKYAHRNPRHPIEELRGTTIYFPACRLCQKEDAERRALTTPQIPDEDLDHTIFLFPDYRPESNVCQMYVTRTYPGARLMGSTINLDLVARYDDAQIVCVRRVPQPFKELTPFNVQKLDDQTNRYNEIERPIDELLPDVLESAPIAVSDCVSIESASLIKASSVDHSELIERIADLFYGYRVQPPNAPDKELRVSFA